MSDWRLQGQEAYLNDVNLCWGKYYPYRKGWDHDHCEFCGKKFSMSGSGLTEGYKTMDSYHWICKECFDDFKKDFSWSVVTCR